MRVYPHCDPFPVKPLYTKSVTSHWEFMQHLNLIWFNISRANFCHLCNFCKLTLYAPEAHVFVLCGALTSAAQAVGAGADSLSMKIPISLH